MHPQTQRYVTGSECGTCDRTDTDYLAQQDDGSTLCQWCVSDTIDGIEIQYEKDFEFIQSDDASTRRRYIVKASVRRKDCDYPFQDYGLGDSLSLAIDEAKQRALCAAFPPESCQCVFEPTTLQPFESYTPVSAPSFQVEQTGITKIPEAAEDPATKKERFKQIKRDIEHQFPTMEIDTPPNGTAPRVPEPGEPLPEKKPFYLWEPTEGQMRNPRGYFMGVATLAEMSEREQRIFLGVESRANCPGERFILCAQALERFQETPQESELFTRLMSSPSVPYLKNVWADLSTPLAAILKPTKDLLKERLPA